MNFGNCILTTLGSMSSSSGHSKKILPKRELQGPRPPPLKVCKDSCKIKKPQPPLPAGSHRPPMIIYAKSPEVIHAKAHDFMNLVQRLTGNSSSSSPSSSVSSSLPLGSLAFKQDSDDAIVNIGRGQEIDAVIEENQVEELDIAIDDNRRATARGVLSLTPSSLPPMSPSFFQSSPNAFPYPYDFGPILYTPNYQDGFLISPRFNL